MDHSMTIPYGFHGAYGMRKWLGPQPKVIPYGFHGMAHGFHGFHMDYTGEDKDLPEPLKVLFFPKFIWDNYTMLKLVDALEIP